MGAKLQALIELQDIELQIVDIRRQLARKERRVSAQSRRVAALRAEQDKEQAEIQQSQVEFDLLDVDIKGRSTNINRLREHLNTVKTNKEYAAVLAQMNNEKADISRLEARALEMMQAVEQRKEELAERSNGVAEEVTRLEGLQGELEQTRQSFAARLEKLDTQRAQASATIDAAALTLFGRLSERYEGEIMAELEQPNPRRDEFVCGGCHMSLRTETANALKVRDEVLTCKSCGRILFIASN